MEKKTASIIGIVLGIAIIIVGFCVQGISIDVYGSSIGRDIAFGADFYTEMYDVTRDVGYAVNGAKTAIAEATEGVCDAIGWLIVAIGLVDIAYFVCKMASCEDDGARVGHNKVTPTTLPPQKDIFASVRENTSTSTVKRCPYCGDIVKLGRCEMCGKEVK